jgi:hypothetical protein
MPLLNSSRRRCHSLIPPQEPNQDINIINVLKEMPLLNSFRITESWFNHYREGNVMEIEP